jgi:hypothetical protein
VVHDYQEFDDAAVLKTLTLMCFFLRLKTRNFTKNFLMQLGLLYPDWFNCVVITNLSVKIG